MLKRGFFDIFSLLIFSLFPFLLLNSFVAPIIYVTVIAFFGAVFIIRIIVKKNKKLKKSESNDIKSSFYEKSEYIEIIYIYISLLSAFIGYQKGDKVILLIFLSFTIVFMVNLFIRVFARK